MTNQNGSKVQINLNQNKKILEYFSTYEALIDSFFNDNEDKLQIEFSIIIIKPNFISQFYKDISKHGALNDEILRERVWIFSATSLLDEFMVNGMPNQNKFFRLIHSLITELNNTGRPIRVYGDMISFLYENGNIQAALALDKLWKIAYDRYNFSLYIVSPDNNTESINNKNRDYIQSSTVLGSELAAI